MSQFGKKEVPGGGSEPPTENLPEIDSITPASAPPGAVVTLQGVNFGRRVTASQVTFDVYAPDLPAVTATIVSWNDSTVQVRVPPMESLGAAGRATVRLRCTAGPGVAIAFVVLGTRPPSIVALAPPTALPGAELVVSGADFGVGGTPGQVITVAGVGVPYTAWNRGEVRLRVPAPATVGGLGPHPVRVHTPWGVSGPVPFTIAELPSIVSVSPGEAAPDQTVTITGSGFGAFQPGASTVQLRFRAQDTNQLVIAPMEIAAWAPTSIRAVVPGLAVLKESGDKELTVHTRVGASVPHAFGVKDVASITTWTRIEPHARTGDLDEGLRIGLRAELADPLWLLGRQWTLGELRGEDAGSPVAVSVEGEAALLRRWRPGNAGTPADLPAGVPLETLVERERVLPVPGAAFSDRRLAAETGLRFLRLLDSHVTPPERARQYRRRYLEAYPLDDDPQAAADADSRRFLAVLSGRAPDGGRLYADLRQALPPELGGAGHLPPVPEITPSDQPAVLAAVADWYAWCTTLVSEPAGEVADEAPAWQPERLEYTFAVAARTADGEVVLEAPQYDEGRLDWYALRRGTGSLGAPDGRGPASAPIAVTVVPAPVSYPGMPAARWWEIEDAAVDFGAIDAGPLDLAHLLFVEFATVFGNDWYSIPLGGLPFGSVVRLAALRITDTFGVQTTAQPFRETEPGGAFRLFQLTDPIQDRRDLLLLPATVLGGIESAPVEEIVFIRDELANLGWAVERTVTSATGRPVRRQETAAPTPTRQLGPSLSYELMTPVPANWIPFVPRAQDTSLRLVRAALRRIMPDGSIQPIPPLGRILEPDTPALSLFDAEVPPEGTQVTRTWQLARDERGSTHLWLGRQKRTATREPSPGLHFDTVRNSAQG